MTKRSVLIKYDMILISTSRYESLEVPNFLRKYTFVFSSAHYQTYSHMGNCKVIEKSVHLSSKKHTGLFSFLKHHEL